MKQTHSNQLRIAFMGTPDFSVPILDVLFNAGHKIVCVYTQPPRSAGRGQGLKKSAVQRRAEELNLKVLTPKNFTQHSEQKVFKNLSLDCAIVAAYGLILPEAILEAPRLGCINVHASLLPRWRGAAPIQRAILAGDSRSGVTIMKMDKGLYTGQVLNKETIPIHPNTTGESLHSELSTIGSRLIAETLVKLKNKEIVSVDQAEIGVTYANKLERNEGIINWNNPAIEIERLIRAFTPWPGSWFKFGSERIKIYSAEISLNTGKPGTILDNNLTVACGSQSLRLKRIQRSGKGIMDTSDFLKGFKLPMGTNLINGKI